MRRLNRIVLIPLWPFLSLGIFSAAVFVGIYDVFCEAWLTLNSRIRGGSINDRGFKHFVLVKNSVGVLCVYGLSLDLNECMKFSERGALGEELRECMDFFVSNKCTKHRVSKSLFFEKFGRLRRNDFSEIKGVPFIIDLTDVSVYID